MPKYRFFWHREFRQPVEMKARAKMQVSAVDYFHYKKPLFRFDIEDFIINEGK
jgi:hypothetical protein